jgi:Niemann-Pick C1 protein
MLTVVLTGATVLVLAIGVDNVFLLSHELARQNQAAYEARQGNANCEDGTIPSLDEDLDPLPPAAERVARALARMGPSILLSTTCEAVAFGLGALVGMPAVRNFAIYAAGSIIINSILQITVFISLMTLDLQRTESNRADCLPCFQMPFVATDSVVKSASLVSRFFKDIYAPALLNAYVKKAVLVVFSLLFVLSWIAAREINLGLGASEA